MFFKKAKNESAKSYGKKFGGSKYDLLIVGLGNPGIPYQNTRHNVGFMAVDYLAEKQNIKIDRKKFNALYEECVIKNKRCLIIKPQTFMNLSGESVVKFMNFYKILPQKTLVIFDDISLDVGKIRIRRKGTDGGHNGIKNIMELSKSNEFPRIKIGVGKKPNPEYDLKDWVLGIFSKEDREKINESLERVYKSVETLLEYDIDKAMCLYNKN